MPPPSLTVQRLVKHLMADALILLLMNQLRVEMDFANSLTKKPFFQTAVTLQASYGIDCSPSINQLRKDICTSFSVNTILFGSLIKLNVSN